MTGLVVRTLAGSALGTLGSILAGVGGIAKSVLAWITASAAHLLAVALALSLAWGYWEHRGRAKDQRINHSTIVQWRATNATNYASAIRANNALNEWSAYVHRWAVSAAKTQGAAQVAIMAARKRQDGLEAHASLIDAARAHAPSGGPLCRTQDAVLASRGDL